jgi:pilus assembly protein TadC
MIEKFIVETASIYDFSKSFSKGQLKRLQTELIQAHIEIKSEEWVSFSIIISLFISICTALLTIIITSNPIPAIFSIIPMFAISFLALFKLPSYQKKKLAEEMERELTIALRTIVIEIKLDLPFEKIINEVSIGNYGKLSGEFQKISREIDAGESVPDALLNFSQRVDSPFISRVVSQLAFCYEHGTKSEALGKLADEISLLQKTKTREFASKMSFLGLLFIAIACIVPALFAAYIIIGSSFLSLSINEADIYIAYLFVFPLMGLVVLLYIKEKTPKVISI